MNSLTKTTVSEHTLQAIVRKQWGSNALLTAWQELKDGYFNSAYLLDLAHGLRCVLKVAPPQTVRVLRYERDLMQAEVSAMELARRHTHMPVAEIYAYDTSNRLLPNEYFLMQHLPGMPLNKIRPQLTAAESEALELEVGRLNRQMNDIHGPAFGYGPATAPRFAGWRAAFLDMMEGVLLDGEEAGVTLPLPYAEIRRRVQHASPALDELETPHLVHWDLWDGNLFIDPLSHHLSGIIDFERALWGDPLMEVGFASAQADTPFMHGYGLRMLDTPGQQLRRTLYSVYVFLIMVIECTYRQFETDDQERWSRPRLQAALEKLGTNA